MAVNSYDLHNGPWQHIPWLVDETNKFYAEHVTPKGLGDCHSLAVEKIIRLRKWETARSLIKANLDSIIQELGICYVPRQMDPGPCIIFPLHDHRRALINAQLKPLWDLRGEHGPLKYIRIGKERVQEGVPIWFGDTDQCLEAIMRYKSVLLVEGYFDLLACRLLHPGAPVLSAGGKSIRDGHVEYLTMLGVRQVHLMFDNETAKEGRLESAGIQAARAIAKKYNGLHRQEYQIHLCPATDPSDCLCDRRTAHALREQLRSLFPVGAAAITSASEKQRPRFRH